MDATFGCRNLRARVGVLIAQLGTPDEPTAPSLRRYLREFLSDRRVIEKNRVLWWLVLNGIVLRVRPSRSAALYRRIWSEKGSPLLFITKGQSEKISALLSERGIDLSVDFGMRYGSPSIASALDRLMDQGCSKILIFPMYAQYSAATTGSVCDAVFKHLGTKRWVPALRIAEPFYRRPAYLSALAESVNSSLAALDTPPEKLVLSYHGVPRSYVEKGDPYCCMCAETTARASRLINFPGKDIIHCYQSRFGRDPWLTPYTDETIESLAKNGVKRIAVACPAFISDCLETMDEIGREARESFLKAGGESFYLIPCLNDSPGWIAAAGAIITDELGGWITGDECSDCAPVVCPAKIAI